MKKETAEKAKELMYDIEDCEKNVRKLKDGGNPPDEFYVTFYQRESLHIDHHDKPALTNILLYFYEEKLKALQTELEQLN